MRRSHLQIALLGLWVGVASLFAFVVAPSAFRVLPTSQLAGQMVSRVLSAVEIIGICVGLLSLILSFGKRRGIAVAEIILLLLLTVSMAISRLLVSARLHSIRLQFGEQLGALAREDPVRSTFDLLHQTSVALLVISLLSAILLLGMLIWRGASK